MDNMRPAIHGVLLVLLVSAVLAFLSQCCFSQRAERIQKLVAESKGDSCEALIGKLVPFALEPIQITVEGQITKVALFYPVSENGCDTFFFLFHQGYLKEIHGRSRDRMINATQLDRWLDACRYSDLVVYRDGLAIACGVGGPCVLLHSMRKKTRVASTCLERFSLGLFGIMMSVFGFLEIATTRIGVIIASAVAAWERG